MQSILCTWDGESLVPSTRHAKELDASLVIGEKYMVEVALPRNMASHRHYFAQIAEVWRNLPEDIAEQHSSSEALRKWALCKTGYCTETRQVFTKDRDAVLAAAFAAASSEYAIVSVNGNVVTKWKPESQSVKAMGADRFKASKAAVLDYIAGLIGVTPQQVAIAAEKDAA